MSWKRLGGGQHLVAQKLAMVSKSTTDRQKYYSNGQNEGGWQMNKKFLIPIAVLAVLAISVGFSVPTYAQSMCMDLGYHAYTLEPGVPGDNIVINATGPATLGEGVVVMKFKCTDYDPLADDNAPLVIESGNVIYIDNLGTAPDTAITQCLIMDEAGFALPGAIATPVAFPAGQMNIQWRCEFTLDEDYTIPDGKMEIFSVAIRIADTDTLLDDFQMNTLKLRVTMPFTEKVGSPSDLVEFSEVITDGAPEIINNSGINDITDDMYVVDPLMPMMMGTVARFTVCDHDSNEHNLYLDQFWVRQDNEGTAEFNDIATLKLFRVESYKRTMIAAVTPDVAFNRGGNGLPLFNPQGANPTLAIVPDDHCAVFEIDAEVSQFAVKWRTIQLQVIVSAEEPRGTQIGAVGGTPGTPPDPNITDPRVSMGEITIIGKGLIQLPDTVVLASPGDIPLNVVAIPLPGLGAIQVGPHGAFRYDPTVIQILEIVGVGDYVVEAVNIDNRRGEAKFTVRIDPAEAQNAVTTGTVAIIRVDGVGQAGDRTRLDLIYDQVTDSNNNVLADTAEQLTLSNVGVHVGEVRLVPPGDIDGNGATTVNDALILAEQLIADPACGDLTDEQKVIGDVAAPFADIDETPTCSGDNPTLTSADVAQIAKLAITGPDPFNGSSVNTASVSPLNVNKVQTSERFGLLEFTAQGTGIESTQVEVYGLNGQQLISAEATGNRLSVRALDSLGRPLSNGVYLYVVTVRGADGTAIRSEVKRLVILR